MTLPGDELLVLTEKGLLLRAPATPDGLKRTARVQALPSDVRAYPLTSFCQSMAPSRRMAMERGSVMVSQICRWITHQPLV